MEDDNNALVLVAFRDEEDCNVRLKLRKRDMRRMTTGYRRALSMVSSKLMQVSLGNE